MNKKEYEEVLAVLKGQEYADLNEHAPGFDILWACERVEVSEAPSLKQYKELEDMLYATYDEVAELQRQPTESVRGYE